MSMNSETPRAALVSPSRTYVNPDNPAEKDEERLRGCAEALAEFGFEVKRSPGEFRNYRRYGGTDAQRSEELQHFLTDPDTDLVIPVRGGYGMVRTLELLPYGKIRDRRPLAMGFSDFTALNLALYSKAGVPSWQGPMAGGLAEGHVTETSAESFLSALTEKDWSLSWKDGTAEAGRREGTVWGGNLSVLVSLIGTPWFPEKQQTEGGILFLEDIGEAPYQIDRMLMQLFYAGILENQSAVLFGEFTGSSRHVIGDEDLRLSDVLSDVREKLQKHGVMTAENLPFGHVARLHAVPVGVPGTAEISSDGRVRLSSSETPLIARGQSILSARLRQLRAASRADESV